MAKKVQPLAKSAILPQPADGYAVDFHQSLPGTLLPASCLLCGADAANAPLCPGCIADLPRLEATSCPQCAHPMPAGGTCGHCQRKPRHFDSTLALYAYTFPADILIQSLKYRAQLALAPWFATQLFEKMAHTTRIERIIALPLHPQRLAERGFNQANEIARRLAIKTGAVLDTRSLQRTRPTLPQAQLPFKAREQNVRHAFSCHTDLSGQHILLIDDVLTTGATASECARTLKLHGAARVSLAVVARALGTVC